MAGKTLVGALPTFTSDLKKSLSEAARKAFLSTLSQGDVDPAIAATIKGDMEKSARVFGETFASSLAPELAKNIYNYIMEIGITLTPKGTLLAPQAPSGVLPITGSASTLSKDIIIT